MSKLGLGDTVRIIKRCPNQGAIGTIKAMPSIAGKYRVDGIAKTSLYFYDCDLELIESKMDAITRNQRGGMLPRYE